MSVLPKAYRTNDEVAERTFGYLDEYDSRDGKLKGWAYDPNCEDESPKIEVFEDDVLMVSGEATLYRADLQAAGYGDGNCAYALLLPEHMLDGRLHRLTVKAQSSAGAKPLIIDREFVLAPRSDKALAISRKDSQSPAVLLSSDASPSAAGEGDSNIPSPSHSTTLIFLEELWVEKESHDNTSLLCGKGWAITKSKVRDITIKVNNIVVGYATYGLARPDVAKFYRDYPGADHSGFEFALKNAAKDAAGHRQIAVTVHSEAGETVSETRILEVNIEPAVKREAASLRPSERIPVRTRLQPLQLHIDDISFDERALWHIAGWAISLTGVPRVEVAVDDIEIGSAEVGRLREDVAYLWPQYPNARYAGFLLIAKLDPRPSNSSIIKVSASTFGGIEREVCIPIATVIEKQTNDTRREVLPRVQIDTLMFAHTGDITIAGWVVCGETTACISVFLDNSVVGDATVGISRPDVGNQFPEYAHARRAGFEFREKLSGLWEGEHLLMLQVQTAGDEITEVPLPVRVTQQSAVIPIENAEPSGEPCDFKLFLDSPVVVGGVVTEPIKENLVLNGWALAKHGVACVDVYVDGGYATSAFYGVRREDIATEFPAWENSHLSGFAAIIPGRRLTNGRHVIGLALRDTRDQMTTFDFSVHVEFQTDEIGPRSLRLKIPESENTLNKAILAALKIRPAFFIFIPLDDSSSLFDLCATMISIDRQAYADWRVFLVSRSVRSGERGLADHLSEIHLNSADRFCFVVLGELDHFIDTLKNSTYANNDTIFHTILYPGDQLGCDALIEYAIYIGMNRSHGFIYADERRASPVTGLVQAFFKPSWSPDLLMSTNYIGRSWCSREGLIPSPAKALEGIWAFGIYDLVLRITAKAKAIGHIPLVLMQSSASRSDAEGPDRKALENTVARSRMTAEVLSGCLPGTFRVRRTTKAKGLVSIIIPTCAARGLIKRCIESLREITAFRNYEILCIENISRENKRWRHWIRSHADKMITTREPFNWSRFNNLTAAEAQGEFFLFLNDDVEVIESDWLDNLLEHAMRPEVGVVGPQLLYPDRRVQHAGLFLTRLGAARHAFRFLPEDEPGYFGLALTQRNVIAVTGACLLTPRRVFEQTGRFNETHSVVNNDLDFCLRVWQQGLLVVFTPHAKLIHHELVSRSRLEDDYDPTIFDNEWRKVYQRGDPYYHQRLSADFDDFRSDHEPVQIVHAGHPLFAKDAVHRILVVKLDHIGDCVTALPAVRRLKSHFHNAKIYVLAAPSTRAIWSTEPVIEDVIDFTFFHARSGLGARELSSSELEQLLVRLQPYRFDIAIDLRKSPDTRHILQYTGASHVTGFDSQARFPWLDISLEWEGDRKFTPKRQHVADDLINLVDALAAACEPDRLVIPRAAAGSLQKPMLRRLFEGRVVCVHPAAGTEMRQWPKEYFAELIDLLVERENVNIALIGGPGEEELNADILERVRHPEAVSPLLGELALSELPSLLTACALFVGNNSGPQHIAAGLGVPTVGIHSGVIDSHEWGPLGPHAVAIRREMTCSPCYLTELKDCHRDLACMKTLLPRDVFQVCKRLLALSNGRQRKGGRGDLPTATKGPKPQSSRRQRTGGFERTTATAKDRQ